MRIAGDQVSYAVRWQDTAAPTALHIHAGARDVNGAIRIGFFEQTLPAGARAVSGTVTVADAALLAALRTNPRDFYVNLHTGEFPGGAVRSQLHALNRGVNLDGVLNGATTADLDASADGNQEVPRGDRDGRGNWLVKAQGTELSYAATWERLGAVTGGRIHAGPRRVNGPVAADLFADAAGLPASITGIAGTATVDADVAQRLNANPRAFYADLRTNEFAAGDCEPGTIATSPYRADYLFLG